jgi:PAS domain S-box-containing protein
VVAQERILIIEDEVLVAESIRDNLVGLGYEVVAVLAYGEEAVKEAATLRPDLVLMDIRLAGEIDGVEAAEQIRASLGIPVIYLTAHAEDEMLQRASLTEPFGYLLKPFRREDLKSTIRMALYKHRVDQQLQEAQRFLQSAFDALSAHIAVLDESGTIVAVNASWRSFADDNGLTWADYGIGHNYLEVCESAAGYGLEGALEVAEGIRQIMGGQLGEFRLDYPCHGPKAGRWFTMRATRFLDTEPVRVVVAHEDITERRRDEEEIRKLSRAVEQSPSVVVITGVQGNIEYANPTFARVTGYAIEEALGRNPRFLKSGELPPEQYELLWKTILSGGEWRGEFCNRKKDGKVYWELASISPIRNADGVITHFLKVAEDITERKRSEAALEWEVTVNTVVAELASALLSLESLDEISDFVLEQAKYLTASQFGFVGYIEPETGYLVCPTLTKEIWDSCQVEDKGIVFREFSGLWGWVLDHRKPLLTNAPADDPRSSGTPIGHLPIRSFLAAPALVGDRLVGQVALANAQQDYTGRDLVLVSRMADLYAIALQRHWAEEALRQRTNELQARNEELDAFAHTVAHDLKNPLSIVVGFAESLEDTFSSMAEEELQEYLGIIAWSSRKMSNIVEELLLLAGVRDMEAEMEPLDMNSIVAEAQQRLAGMIAEYQAEIILPPAWPVVWGHAPWVEEVWVNYLSNALKYGGHPPIVELGFDWEAQANGANVQSGEPVVRNVRLWIRDNGPGLPPEEQSRLFVPFTKLAQVRAEGHGLGLSIVRRIVEKLGGQVGVRSSGVPGEGCEFSFTLRGMPE